MTNDPHSFTPNKASTDSLSSDCLSCEALFVDALDGTLSAAEQAFFDRHLRLCTECANAFGEAQRGAAWLDMLKSPRPQPRPELLAKILAQTSGSLTVEAAGQVFAPAATTPLYVPAPAGRLLAFRPPPATMHRLGRILLEPRLAMTAAMAFFSITLTMSLTGVRLNELHASDLSPSGIRRTAHGVQAGAVRYYDNLRVVHVLESRVDDLRENLQQHRDEEAPVAPEPVAPEPAPPAPPAQKTEPRKESSPDGGTSLNRPQKTRSLPTMTALVMGMDFWNRNGDRA